MKRKERTSMQELSPEELKKQIDELKRSLVVLKVDRFTKQTKNAREMKNKRIQVAVLSTILRQKELQHG